MVAFHNSDSSESTFSDSVLNDSEIIRNNFSLVHYNVQCALHKADILESELSNFDIISFSETWFDKDVNNSDIILDNYGVPFRNDATMMLMVESLCMLRIIFLVCAGLNSKF